MARLGPFEIGCETHPGKVREQNEDASILPPAAQSALGARGYLFAVADGMGGYGGGQEASQVSLATLHEQFYGPESATLADSIQRANMAVRRRSMQPDHDPRMGSTLVAALFQGDALVVAHVGDSRAYLVRGGAIHQLTEDHSLVQEQVRAGLMRPGEAGPVGGKNVITRSMGSKSVVDAEFTPVPGVQRGDTIVLCSDGLTNMVTDAEIAAAVSAQQPEPAARALVQLANERGGPDNITVQVIRVLSLPFTAQAPPASGIARTLRMAAPRSRLRLVLVIALLVVVIAGLVTLLALNAEPIVEMLASL
ncbi:MAG TPA: protein phosphatase 2C domain-containing protein [Chloroflexaceae bacterium]|nr:protein phosphatase 2C domain-containing protein [Chloroflexaceae bacterium]